MKRNQRMQVALLVFSCGALFLAALLAVALRISEPTPTTFFVMRVILSLAAAAFSSLVPGSLDVEVHGYIRAGGALAVFIVVLLVPLPN